MKIYFAGSIRAGREDAALYRDIISFLAERGEVAYSGSKLYRSK